MKKPPYVSSVLLDIALHGPSSVNEVLARAKESDGKELKNAFYQMVRRGSLTLKPSQATLTMEPSKAASLIEADPKATTCQKKHASNFRLVEDKVGTQAWADAACKVLAAMRKRV